MTSWFKAKLGGRVRVSTVGAHRRVRRVVWVQQTFEPEPPHPTAPVPAVVPPGFVPDPNYTWVPRTQVRRPKEPVTTTTTTPTTTTTTETTTPGPDDTTSETSPSPTTTVIDPDGPGGPLGPQTLTQTPTRDGADDRHRRYRELCPPTPDAPR